MSYGNRFYRAPSAATLAKRAATRVAFLAANPGLEDALNTDHSIVRDIAAKLAKYGSVSPATVALVLKLAKETTDRAAARAAEVHAVAPLGKKVTFTGTIVSSKYRTTKYGTTLKLTVKVTTETGATWLAWGTCPAAIEPSSAYADELRGATVELTAELRAGNEPHFVFFKRPRGRLVTPVVAAEETPAAEEGTSEIETALRECREALEAA